MLFKYQKCYERKIKDKYYKYLPIYILKACLLIPKIFKINSFLKYLVRYIIFQVGANIPTYLVNIFKIASRTILYVSGDHQWSVVLVPI